METKFTNQDKDLTSILGKRVIAASRYSKASFCIQFDDESTLTVEVSRDSAGFHNVDLSVDESWKKKIKS